MSRLGQLRYKFWLARQQLKPKAAILMFHRIIDLPHDPYQIAVSPENFEQQMALIKRDYYPISLLELVEGLKKNKIPRKAIVVTFDDGYFDNYTNALPIMEAAEIPWTLFATTDLIGSQCEAWWDELSHIMIAAENVPTQLTLNVMGKSHTWDMTTAQSRQSACFGVHSLLLPLTVQEREHAVQQLFEWATIERNLRTNYRMMTLTQFAEVAQSKFVDLGGHTHSHPYLSSLSRDEQFREIAHSRQLLQEKYNQNISTFAYPFGGFSEETVDVVKEAGFDAAVTVHETMIRADNDLFLLGRYQVKNWNVNEFSQKLKAIY